MERFTAKTVDEFLEALASSEPTPGGGSGAALAGALAAGLLSMVCNLTIGKKGYEGVQADMEAILSRSEAIRHELPDLLQADTQVYGKVMEAYRLPRKSPEEKAAREAAMQAALKAAAQAPLTIAARCGEIVTLCVPAAQKGNKWAVSDAGVAVALAEAAMRGALLNVHINLASIQDAAFSEQMRARIAEITDGKAALQAEVSDSVMKSIQG